MEKLPPIPHAPPMHWLDDAVLSEDGLRATATRKITPDHPFVHNGFFIPTALVELLAQAAAAGSALKAQRQGRRIRRGVLAVIREFRIDPAGRLGVPIGATIHLTAVHERTLGALSMGMLEAHVDGVRIASGRMTFHLEFE